MKKYEFFLKVMIKYNFKINHLLKFEIFNDKINKIR
jgi:hypothetical protein